jgi:hypothetical protein
MGSEKVKVTRRDFIFASAIVVSSPMFPYLPMIATGEATAVEGTKVAAAPPLDHDDSKCRGCNVCAILYSDCRTINNRDCWCRTEKGGRDNDC